MVPQGKAVSPGVKGGLEAILEVVLPKVCWFVT